MVMAALTALKSTNDDLGMGYSYCYIVKELMAAQGIEPPPNLSYRRWQPCR